MTLYAHETCRHRICNIHIINRLYYVGRIKYAYDISAREIHIIFMAFNPVNNSIKKYKYEYQCKQYNIVVEFYFKYIGSLRIVTVQLIF